MKHLSKYIALSVLCIVGVCLFGYFSTVNFVQFFRYPQHWLSHFKWYLLYATLAILNGVGCGVCVWLFAFFADKTVFLLRSGRRVLSNLKIEKGGESSE